MAGMTPVLRILALLALIAAPALAVEEPDGYRTSDYDAPVPETVRAYYMVDTYPAARGSL